MEANEYQVASALAGRVTEVKVAEGDTVTEGQELVRLDRSALKLQLDQAKQGVIAAKAALTNAKDDGTKADVTAARARLAQARAAVKLAEVQLGYTIVTAPRDGMVVSVITNVGQNAAPGKTLLTMIDPTDLFVRVFVPETEIGKVKVGQAATLTTDSSSDHLPGHGHLHRQPGGVHAEQRPDQGPARQARLRGAGARHRRRRHAQARHAGGRDLRRVTMTATRDRRHADAAIRASGLRPQLRRRSSRSTTLDLERGRGGGVRPARAGRRRQVDADPDAGDRAAPDVGRRRASSATR